MSGGVRDSGSYELFGTPMGSGDRDAIIGQGAEGSERAEEFGAERESGGMEGLNVKLLVYG